MNWEQFYLVCFGLGFVLSLTFAFTGAFHLHLPGKFAHGHGHGKAGARDVHGLTHVSPFNLFSVMAFLAWFGAAGYLLTKYSSFVALTALGLSALSGLVGGGIVFYFLAGVMLRHEHVLDDADFEMVGVIGRVSGRVLPEGVGEILFEQNGRTKHCGARSADGVLIERDSEVVVTRFERGIAWVKPWEEFLEPRTLQDERRTLGV
ncbi:MAG: hypothetical protein NVS9B15_08040 [Acidobacteriaceae bacterium]